MSVKYDESVVRVLAPVSLFLATAVYTITSYQRVPELELQLEARLYGLTMLHRSGFERHSVAVNDSSVIKGRGKMYLVSSRRDSAVAPSCV